MLYIRPSLGGKNKIKTLGIKDYNHDYSVQGIIPIKKDVVLIHEIDLYHEIRSIVYLFNARMNHVVYRFQQSTHYCCDILHKLSNGKIILRFDMNFLEIWDFALIQCDTKIYAFEVSSIQELEDKRVVLISPGGIQIINLKF